MALPPSLTSRSRRVTWAPLGGIPPAGRRGVAFEALLNTVMARRCCSGACCCRACMSFGGWDWAVNGVIFGWYLSTSRGKWRVEYVNRFLSLALPTKRFHSTWMGIAVHSTQSVYFALIFLPILLGRGSTLRWQRPPLPLSSPTPSSSWRGLSPTLTNPIVNCSTETSITFTVIGARRTSNFAL